jgi:hypothetical protein
MQMFCDASFERTNKRPRDNHVHIQTCDNGNEGDKPLVFFSSNSEDLLDHSVRPSLPYGGRLLEEAVLEIRSLVFAQGVHECHRLHTS